MKLPCATLGFLLAGVSACASADKVPVPSCTSDEQCGPNESCFVEGCADLGQDVVVELTGDAMAGKYSRDVAIVSKLGPVRDFEFGGPLVVRGELSREGDSPPWYALPVRIQALGSSDLIPGVWRSYERRFDNPLRGTFEMNLGAGTFVMTATPDDLSIPPVSGADGGVQINSPLKYVQFNVPSADSTLTISGRLIAKISTARAPEIAITQAAVDLQAFSPDEPTHVPLSQRFPVSSGQPGSNGNFTMTLSPAATDLKSVLFRASPRFSGAPVPTKIFVIDTPIPSPLTLELGEFTSLVQVSGHALGLDGSPIAQATVIIGGIVPGGGTFTSQIAVTGEDGAFTLQTLPGQDELSLTVLPPPKSRWAIATRQVRVTSAPSEALLVTCGQRVVISGTVAQPDGRPAAGTRVKATPFGTSTFDSRLLPLTEVETTVDQNGEYVLPLDQSTWQLTFISTDLPLMSRSVTVGPMITDGAWAFEIAQERVQLRSGRLVSGQVVFPAGSTSSPVAFAGLRFFRVAPIEGTFTGVFLGSAVADASGHYSVVLPTR